jgi:hypothetical protein
VEARLCSQFLFLHVSASWLLPQNVRSSPADSCVQVHVPGPAYTVALLQVVCGVCPCRRCRLAVWNASRFQVCFQRMCCIFRLSGMQQIPGVLLTHVPQIPSVLHWCRLCHCADSAAQLSRAHCLLQPLGLLSILACGGAQERVEKAGGQVLYWNGHRVMGVLAMSRAIGDHMLRPYVIAEPEVRSCLQLVCVNAVSRHTRSIGILDRWMCSHCCAGSTSRCVCWGTFSYWCRSTLCSSLVIVLRSEVYSTQGTICWLVALVATPGVASPPDDAEVVDTVAQYSIVPSHHRQG